MGYIMGRMIKIIIIIIIVILDIRNININKECFYNKNTYNIHAYII
jgi:hypothetical protein